MGDRSKLLVVMLSATLAACAAEDANICTDPTGLYRATVTWKTPTCSTPATTVQFLITEDPSDDLWWRVELSPWNAKGTLEAVSGPSGCLQLEFATDVGTAGTATEHYDGYFNAFGGDFSDGTLAGAGYRTVSGTAPCRGDFKFEYVVKVAD